MNSSQFKFFSIVEVENKDLNISISYKRISKGICIKIDKEYVEKMYFLRSLRVRKDHNVFVFNENHELVIQYDLLNEKIIKSEINKEVTEKIFLELIELVFVGKYRFNNMVIFQVSKNHNILTIIEEKPLPNASTKLKNYVEFKHDDNHVMENEMYELKRKNCMRFDDCFELKEKCKNCDRYKPGRTHYEEYWPTQMQGGYEN